MQPVRPNLRPIFPHSRVASCEQIWRPKRVKKKNNGVPGKMSESGKGRGREKLGGASNLEARNIGRVIILPVVPVRAARAAFHSQPRIQHAMWRSPRSRARFNRACVRRALASLSTTAMLFLSAWRYKSCRQTTHTDGVFPRSARRGFGEQHFSVKL